MKNVFVLFLFQQCSMYRRFAQLRYEDIVTKECWYLIHENADAMHFTAHVHVRVVYQI